MRAIIIAPLYMEDPCRVLRIVLPHPEVVARALEQGWFNQSQLRAIEQLCARPALPRRPLSLWT